MKLLILGESHYGTKGTETADFTRKIVTQLGQENRHRFFTTIAKLVRGIGSGHISNKQRATFWDHVAFANYIQSFVAENAKARARPTEEMWQHSKAALMATLQEVNPDAVLVLGLDMARHLPEDIPGAISVHSVRHPSQYFRYGDWMPGVQRFLSDARNAG